MSSRWLALLALGGCTSPSPKAAVEQAPKTETVEGHGGIAVAPLAPARQPSAPTPAASAPPSYEAKELYLRAYSMRELQPENAKRLFQEVVRLTPGDSELHLKATQQIKGLP